MVGKNTQYHRFERSIDLSKQPKVLEVKRLVPSEKKAAAGLLTM